MKRAFTVAAFGGLLVFFVPQAASGGTARPVAPYDHGADHKGDCAGQPAGAAESEQAPPQQHPYGDREQKESDGGEILF